MSYAPYFTTKKYEPFENTGSNKYPEPGQVMQQLTNTTKPYDLVNKYNDMKTNLPNNDYVIKGITQDNKTSGTIETNITQSGQNLSSATIKKTNEKTINKPVINTSDQTIILPVSSPTSSPSSSVEKAKHASDMKPIKNTRILSQVNKTPSYKVDEPSRNKVDEPTINKVNEPTKNKVDEPSRNKVNEPSRNEVNEPIKCTHDEKSIDLISIVTNVLSQTLTSFLKPSECNCNYIHNDTNTSKYKQMQHHTTDTDTSKCNTCNHKNNQPYIAPEPKHTRETSNDKPIKHTRETSNDKPIKHTRETSNDKLTRKTIKKYHEQTCPQYKEESDDDDNQDSIQIDLILFLSILVFAFIWYMFFCEKKLF